MKWNPPTIKPEYNKGLLLLTCWGDSRSVHSGDCVQSEGKDWFQFTDSEGEVKEVMSPTDSHLLGWMYADAVIHLPMAFDPNFGDDRLCECGDPYYRHFDTYEDMEPVGCKYCFHTTGEWQKDKIRDHYKNGGTELSVEELTAMHGRCGGFKLAEGQ